MLTKRAQSLDSARSTIGSGLTDMISPEPPSSVGVTPGTWKKHIWKAAEDELLHALVAGALRDGGKVRWSAIGAQMNGRSGKQCRERWHNRAPLPVGRALMQRYHPHPAMP